MAQIESVLNLKEPLKFIRWASIATFVEDAAMAGMAGVMLFWLLAQRWVI